MHLLAISLLTILAGTLCSQNSRRQSGQILCLYLLVLYRGRIHPFIGFMQAAFAG